MTPEDRARALHAGWSNRTLWKEEMILDVEKAIKGAIEEERSSVVEFLRAQAAGFQVLIDHAPTPIRAEDLKRVKHSIEVVIDQIRARST